MGSIIQTTGDESSAADPVVPGLSKPGLTPRPLNSTSIRLADQEYTEQKSKSKTQEMTFGFFGRYKRSLSPVAQQYGSQLHPLWNQLPYHKVSIEKNEGNNLLATESSHKQKFADDLCQWITADTLSALGRLFIPTGRGHQL